MQQTFCTNCGKPLTPGAAFCPSCGTPVGASAASPTSFSPQQPNAPAAAPRSQTGKIIGGLLGCLALFLIVVLALIGALVYGILKQQPVFFFVGLVGLGLIILVGVGIEHLIRRLYHRARGGIERLEHPGYGYSEARRREEARRRQQHRFHPIRFLITLVLIAGALYGGLFYYYNQQFSGDWQGVLSVGTVKQGILLSNLRISLSFQRPANFSTSNPGAIELTQVNFTQETAQACNKNGGQDSYQISGSTSRLDASQVSMTLKSSQTTYQLQGTYQNGTFTLSGTSQGKPVTLTLQKGGQSDFSATCKQLT